MELGKRHGQALMATNVPGNSHSRLFYITDKISNHKFLVDTGAEISVIPPNKYDRHRRSLLMVLNPYLQSTFSHSQS